MLAQAADSGLPLVQANALDLPFADDSFDVAVSFKVLAHIEDIRGAIAEMARVVRPGGVLALEFYNRHSIRSLIKAVKPPSAIGDGVDDTEVYTRYDSLEDIRGYLPAGATIERLDGIRVVIPAASVMQHPAAARVIGAVDRRLGRTPLARLGGFLLVLVRLP